MCQMLCRVRLVVTFFLIPISAVELLEPTFTTRGAFVLSVVRYRVGCMLAGFLLNREPFFRGKDNEDQLVRIALVLGTQGLHDFLRKYGEKPRHRDVLF